MTASPDLAAFSNRRLEADEIRAYLDAPVSDAEREEAVALTRWFLRRYPTPIERLAYIRRAYARWQRTAGSPPRSEEPH